MLVSYTLPCHKRAEDLAAVLPSVILAANQAPPVEIVIVDYGHPGTLEPMLCSAWKSCRPGVTISRIRAERQYFHMAHARNVGIREAGGHLVVAFLADQVITPEFFSHLRREMQPGQFLRWRETFIFNRAEILAAGGFDERFEFYGPEGKELTDRLIRRGLTMRRLSGRYVDQRRTPYQDKIQHYRLPLSRREMHERGMAVWRENQAAGLLVANQGQDWGAIEAAQVRAS